MSIVFCIVLFLSWNFYFKNSENNSKNTFIGAASNRSSSDNGTYVAFVEEAVRNYSVFENFKRHPHYTMILEHVSMDLGTGYLDVIKDQAPDFLADINKFKINDLIGNPVKYSYPLIGEISPTTLRYMKVASDLRKYFGKNIGKKIVEIGVGYGGQLLVADQVFNFSEYHLYDLPPVLELTSRYLESHILNGSYKAMTLNQNSGNEVYDLVISNYGFSELPLALQKKYAEKILSKATKGYLTMNTGLHNIPLMRKMLPPFQVFEEKPLSSPNNYIIVWGTDVKSDFKQN